MCITLIAKPPKAAIDLAIWKPCFNKTDWNWDEENFTGFDYYNWISPITQLKGKTIKYTDSAIAV